MICTPSDVTTYLGIPSMTALATLCQQMAEQSVKDYLGTQEIEQQSWTEYYPLDYAAAAQPGDPHYIVDSAYQRAIPGFYRSDNIIQLRQLAVRQITSVNEDATGYFGQVAGSFGAGTLLTSGSDYYVKYETPALSGGLPISWSGQIVRRSFWFPAIAGSVKVVYVAGFTAGELAGRWSVFKRACLEEIGDLFLRGLTLAGGQRADIASQSLGEGASTSFIQAALSGLEVCDRTAQLLSAYVNYGELAL